MQNSFPLLVPHPTKCEHIHEKTYAKKKKKRKEKTYVSMILHQLETQMSTMGSIDKYISVHTHTHTHTQTHTQWDAIEQGKECHKHNIEWKKVSHKKNTVASIYIKFKIGKAKQWCKNPGEWPPLGEKESSDWEGAWEGCLGGWLVLFLGLADG